MSRFKRFSVGENEIISENRQKMILRGFCGNL